MNEDSYIDQVRRQLMGFSVQEQADFLDEIVSHIECGKEDPSLGERRTMDEMGNPKQMGRGLRNVHRPGRLVDLFFVLIPSLSISPLIQMLVNFYDGPIIDWSKVDPHMFLRGWIPFLLAMLLTMVGIQRRSTPLTLFWFTHSVGLLVFPILMSRVDFMPGMEWIPYGVIQRFIVYALLIGLLCWIIVILKQNRFDMLLVMFALLPLLMFAANFSISRTIVESTIPHIRVELSGNMLANLGSGFAWIIGLSLFFLVPTRDARWLGILLLGILYIYRTLINFSILSIFTPLSWSVILALVILAWGSDWRNRRADSKLFE